MNERPTLATRLNSSRRARFVGREREIEQFRAAGPSAPELMSLGRIEAAPARASVAMLVGILTTLMPVIEATNVATAAEIELPTLSDRLVSQLIANQGLVFPPPLITAWTRVG